MTTIYIRIPRDRWTPIGEIDLWNGGITIDPRIEERIQKVAELTEKISEYRKKHHIRSDRDERLAENLPHMKAIRELRLQRWEQNPYNYIQNEYRPNRMKANEESRTTRANDRALASVYEKLTGDRRGWYWLPQTTRDKFLNLPLREAKEALKRAVQKQREQATSQ